MLSCWGAFKVLLLLFYEGSVIVILMIQINKIIKLKILKDFLYNLTNAMNAFLLGSLQSSALCFIYEEFSHFYLNDAITPANRAIINWARGNRQQLVGRTQARKENNIQSARISLYL